MAPTFCVVVVNWNKKVLLERMLESLFEDIGADMPVCLVDNASTDGSVSMVHQRFGTVNIFALNSNQGGAGGFQMGLEWALQLGTEYIWLLDNDVEICRGACQALLQVLESDPRIGLAGSKVLHKENPAIVSEAGALLKGELFTPQPIRGNQPNSPMDNIHECDYVPFCSAMVRSCAARQAGAIDSRYFLFWDDMDWGYRFRQAGWKVVGCEASVVVHPGFSERSPSTALAYYGARNRLFFLARTFPEKRRLWRLAHYSGFLAGKRFLYHFRANAISDAMVRGEKDFWKRKMGMAPADLKTRIAPSTKPNQKPAAQSRWWIIAARPVEQMRQIIQSLIEAAPGVQIMLAVPSNRLELFKDFPVATTICRFDIAGQIQDLRQRSKLGIQIVGLFWDQADIWCLEFGSHQIVILDENGFIISMRSGRPFLGLKLLLKKLAGTRIAWGLGWIKGLWRGITKDISWTQSE